VVLILTFVSALPTRAGESSDVGRRQAFRQAVISGNRALAFRTMNQIYPYRVIARSGRESMRRTRMI
jgi:hypothetical protein